MGEGLDELSPEQRKEILEMVVDQITVDRENNLDITLAIPIEDDAVAIASQPSPRGGGGGEGRVATRPYGMCAVARRGVSRGYQGIWRPPLGRMIWPVTKSPVCETR